MSIRKHDNVEILKFPTFTGDKLRLYLNKKETCTEMSF